ncbi:MAG: preprotein translocase subunit SecE [Clostridia bacterium]|nr:preprotein translocase subunit SecE [Clostridia bacterium]
MADNTEKKAVQKVEKAAPKKEKKPNIFKRIGKWFRDIINEIKKITWPTMNQTLKNTLIVIVMVLVVGAYIWILDAILSYGISLLRTLVA